MPIQSEFHRYLNVRASSGGTLRCDRRLAFLNTAGVNQVWTGRVLVYGPSKEPFTPIALPLFAIAPPAMT